jgi:hypothetical protein
MERVANLNIDAKSIESNIILNRKEKEKLIRGYKRIEKRTEARTISPSFFPLNFEQFAKKVYSRGHVANGSVFAPGGGCLPLNITSVTDIAKVFIDNYEKFAVSSQDCITIVWVYNINLF